MPGETGSSHKQVVRVGVATMRGRLPSLRVLLLGAAATLLVALNLDAMWSQSVDLAHHYALAYRISESWVFSNANDPSLGEMNFYPRLAHVLAVLIGRFVNSTFLGMQLASLIALACLWGGLAFAIQSLRSMAAIVSSIVLCSLLLLNRAYFNFELHGAELVENFFFSQLVAQALVAVAIAVAIHLEKTLAGGRVTRTLFLMACIYVTTGVHLLPALELFGVLIVIVAWDCHCRWKVLSARKRVTDLAIAAGVIGASLTSIVLNPAFAAMRKISENNGGMTLTHVAGISSLVVICVLALALSIWLLVIFFQESIEGREPQAAVKYVGAFGLAVAGFCLLQLLALRFGFGSEYAGKKYAFGLFTHLIVSVSVLAGLLADRRSAVPSHLRAISGVGRYFLFLLTFSIAASAAMFHKKTLDVSDVVALERKLVAASDMTLTARPARPSVAIGLSGMPATVDYMFSIATLKAPRERAVPEVLVARQLVHLADYEYIVTSTDSRPYDRTECRLPSFSGSISVLRAACVNESFGIANRCAGTIDFSARGSIDPAALRGFSVPEDHGRWSDGPQAAFECVASDTPPKRMIIHAIPFLYGAQQSQRLAVHVKSIRSEFLLRDGSQAETLVIQLPAVKSGEKIVAEFTLPDAKSPRSLGLSEDVRTLGVSIRSIEFD